LSSAQCGFACCCDACQSASSYNPGGFRCLGSRPFATPAHPCCDAQQTGVKLRADCRAMARQAMLALTAKSRATLADTLNAGNICARSAHRKVPGTCARACRGHASVPQHPPSAMRATRDPSLTVHGPVRILLVCESVSNHTFLPSRRVSNSGQTAGPWHGSECYRPGGDGNKGMKLNVRAL